MDDDVHSLRDETRAMRETLAAHGEILGELKGDVAELKEATQEQTARLDSMDAQMRSLTSLVGHVLDRLPPADDARS